MEKQENETGLSEMHLSPTDHPHDLTVGKALEPLSHPLDQRLELPAVTRAESLGLCLHPPRLEAISAEGIGASDQRAP